MITRPSLLRLAPALAVTGLLSWAGPAAAQDTSCRGWTASCAAVEIRAEGDRLILFSPNVAPPEGGTDIASDARLPSDRVRVLADRPGAACEAETGAGCEDVTSVWAATPAEGVTADDPGNHSCRRDDVWMARARGMEEGENRCRRGPVGAFFLVALPVGLYVLGPDGQAPLIEHPLPGNPGAGLPDSGDPGSGGDSSGGDSTGGGTGGDSSGGGTGGDSTGGNTGGDSTGGNTGGDSTGGNTGGDSTGGNTGGGNTGGGNTGGGNTGGDDGSTGGSDEWDGELGLPPATRPPMSEVPEPISTTLFGLGLAGYAGAQLKKRRAARLEGDEGPA